MTLVIIIITNNYLLKARGGGVNVIFSVFTYVTELLKTNK